MKFKVKFDIFSEAEHIFNEGRFETENLYEGIPIPFNAFVEDEDGRPIGHIDGYLLDNDPDFFYKCDNESGDIAAIAEAICNEDGMVDMLEEDDKVFILDRIVIEESHSGLGIGSNIMKNLPYILLNQLECFTTVFLCASDFETAGKFGFESQEYKEMVQTS